MFQSKITAIIECNTYILIPSKLNQDHIDVLKLFAIKLLLSRVGPKRNEVADALALFGSKLSDYLCQNRSNVKGEK